ncbi:MAG: PIN domain-containing protein [Nitrososphaerota archaeon]
MRGGSSAYPEGVVDVSIIVPTCFENPIKEESIAFLADVLLQKKKAAMPVTAVIGAYHIATRYLRIPRLAVKKVMKGILTSKSPALYPRVDAEIALDALEYAATYNIESWDGYLVALTKSLGSTIIYTLDTELSKIKEITTVNPFPQEKVKQYHQFIKEKQH